MRVRRLSPSDRVFFPPSEEKSRRGTAIVVPSVFFRGSNFLRKFDHGSGVEFPSEIPETVSLFSSKRGGFTALRVVFFGPSGRISRLRRERGTVSVKNHRFFKIFPSEKFLLDRLKAIEFSIASRSKFYRRSIALRRSNLRSTDFDRLTAIEFKVDLARSPYGDRISIRASRRSTPLRRRPSAVERRLPPSLARFCFAKSRRFCLKSKIALWRRPRRAHVRASRARLGLRPSLRPRPQSPPPKI